MYDPGGMKVYKPGTGASLGNTCELFMQVHGQQALQEVQ